MQAIKEMQLTRPGNFSIYPGHGFYNTGGLKKSYNPFAGHKAVY